MCLSNSYASFKAPFNPSSYLLPSSSIWNHILFSYIMCAFITALSIGVSISSLDEELLEVGRL